MEKQHARFLILLIILVLVIFFILFRADSLMHEIDNQMPDIGKVNREEILSSNTLKTPV